MRDADDLKDLKREYMELVRIHGEAVTGFKRFNQSLLELNRRHRLEAARMYANAILKIEMLAPIPCADHLEAIAMRGHYQA